MDTTTIPRFPQELLNEGDNIISGLSDNAKQDLPPNIYQTIAEARVTEHYWRKLISHEVEMRPYCILMTSDKRNLCT